MQLDLVADMAGRLTDDLEVVKDRVDGLAVGGELVEGQAGDLGGTDRLRQDSVPQLALERLGGEPSRRTAPRSHGSHADVK
jgi:hypothetical protein